MTTFLWRRNRHRSRQLELHLYEASIGTILILLTKRSVTKENTFLLKCMDMLQIVNTHHVHEKVAVDLSIVFLHLLRNICRCQLVLSPFNLFILEGTSEELQCYTSRCQCSPPNHKGEKKEQGQHNTPEQVWHLMGCNIKNVTFCNNYRRYGWVFFHMDHKDMTEVLRWPSWLSGQDFFTVLLLYENIVCLWMYDKQWKEGCVGVWLKEVAELSCKSNSSAIEIRFKTSSSSNVISIA